MRQIKYYMYLCRMKITNIDEKNIFGKRLKLARQKKGYSMEELSALTGHVVSKQTISKYEAGKVMAGTEIIQKLAVALGVTMDYFHRAFTFDINEVSISFRKKASVKVKDEQVLKSEIQDKVEHYLEIEKILSQETIPFSPMDIDTISEPSQMIKLARLVRTNWEIGNAPIENVKEILIKHGVKVFDVDGPDGFDGVSGIVNKSTWIIVLNKKITHVERRRLTALHEYGHLIANQYFSQELSKKEKEDMCTLFASEVLLPSQILLYYSKGKNKISWQELMSLQCIFGLSVDALMYRMKRIGIISDKRYRSYNITKSMNPDFKKNAEKSRYVEKTSELVDEWGTYKTMVYSALAQELITPAKAAELLGCTVGEIQTQNIAF